MLHTIENDVLRVTVSDKGAELVSVFDKERNAERIWCANPDVWNRHAPILFPFVGRVAGNKYRYNGEEYEMKTQHGFARDCKFEFVPMPRFLKDDDEMDLHITHRLLATRSDEEIYPFAYELYVYHTLRPGKSRELIVSWRVENKDSGEEMYYSIGGHPGFSVLTEQGMKRDDMYLEFPEYKNGEKAELNYILLNKEGLAVSDKTYKLELEDGCCAITPDFFDRDALIFEGNQINQVRLLDGDKKPFVTLSCKRFPYVGIWSKPNGEFICLEPWFGRTDDEGFSGELSEKKGVRHLKPGEEALHRYMIEFH